MVIASKGKTYETISDAAVELGVSAKTVREWIAGGIIDPPPEIEYGRRTLMHFPRAYLKRAKARIKRERLRRSVVKNRNGRRTAKG